MQVPIALSEDLIKRNGVHHLARVRTLFLFFIIPAIEISQHSNNHKDKLQTY